MSGLARIRGLAKYCLIWIKARSHSSFHPARLAPLRVAKNGFKRFVYREINHPKATNRPVSHCTSFLELGAGDSRMALSWEGFVRPEKFQILEKEQNRNFDYKIVNFG